MTPLRFKPLVKRARWGGTRLGSVLGKPTGTETDYAESWEFSDHGADQSVIVGGPWDGITLQDFTRHYNEALFGRHSGLKQFPLLVKFLDASDRLSVQVHPNDIQARILHPGENGKTEAWVIVDAQPGACVYAGLKQHVDQFRLEQHLKNDTIEECLHRVEVQPGDCIFIPAGTVHAIGEGILLAEVQQSSDLTYRLSDWGRMGADGKPRQLHIEESLACIDWDRGPVNPTRSKSVVSLRESAGQRYDTDEIAACEYFVLHRHTGTVPFPLHEQGCFHALLVLDGEGDLVCGFERIELRRGSSVLVPAVCSGDIELVPHRSLTVLDAFLPAKTAWQATDESVEVEEVVLV